MESDSYILDHTVDFGFADEVASSNNYQEVTGNTALQVFCGNKIVEPGEECDDGNFIDGDGCSSVCRVECGNGLLEG